MKLSTKYHHLFIVVILFTFVLSSCFSYKTPVRNSNVAYIYNPSSTPLHPQYKVFHNEDSTSLVFIKLTANELLYIKKLNDKKPEAAVQIHYKLFDSFTGNNIIDSATQVFFIEKDSNLFNITFDITIKAKNSKRYLLDIIATDIYRGRGNQHFIEVDKSTEHTHQNYLVTLKTDNEPLFKNYLNNKTEFQIKHKNLKNKKLFVSYYKGKYKLPAPPFSVSMMKTYVLAPDSTWEIMLTDTSTFNLEKYGMYHFRIDTSYRTGLILFNFGKYYPVVKTHVKLIEPIRYLTTSREFKEYMMFENKKEAVDNFWLKSTGNLNRAKELIRVYYNRVKFANTYFSSFTEGWRTDRGMLYMIYGSPNTIYKNDNQERWIYGNTQGMHTMSYTFVKVSNPYSNNDYVLNRSDIYKMIWYQAVETWRNGRVFSIVK